MSNITVTGRFTGGALFSPKQTGENGKQQYTLNLVLDDGEETKIEEAVKAAIAEKWGGKTPSNMNNWAVRKGDDPEFASSYGKFFINAKANTVSSKGVPMKRPGTFIRRGGKIEPIEAEEEIIYPGCYVAAEISVYAFDGDKAKNIKPGVTISFSKVLYRKNGERLSSQTSADDAFAGFDDSELADEEF